MSLCSNYWLLLVLLIRIIFCLFYKSVWIIMLTLRLLAFVIALRVVRNLVIPTARRVFEPLCDILKFFHRIVRFRKSLKRQERTLSKLFLRLCFHKFVWFLVEILLLTLGCIHKLRIFWRIIHWLLVINHLTRLHIILESNLFMLLLLLYVDITWLYVKFLIKGRTLFQFFRNCFCLRILVSRKRHTLMSFFETSYSWSFIGHIQKIFMLSILPKTEASSRIFRIISFLKSHFLQESFRVCCLTHRRGFQWENGLRFCIPKLHCRIWHSCKVFQHCISLIFGSLEGISGHQFLQEFWFVNDLIFSRLGKWIQILGQIRVFLFLLLIIILACLWVTFLKILQFFNVCNLVQWPLTFNFQIFLTLFSSVFNIIWLLETGSCHQESWGIQIFTGFHKGFASLFRRWNIFYHRFNLRLLFLNLLTRTQTSLELI